jgi:hypothetical protein
VATYVSPTPLLHALHMAGPFEVVGILCQPSLLACGLARLPALGKMTEFLPFAVTMIGNEVDMTVNTLLFLDRRHDMLPPCQSSDVNNNMGRK